MRCHRSAAWSQPRQRPRHPDPAHLPRQRGAPWHRAAHVRTIFTINLTTADGLFSAGQFQIRSGDVIYATESPTIVTRSILGMTALLFGVANQTNNF